MPKSFIAALALIACCTTGSAFAQSYDGSEGTGGGEAPTLIMPGLLTNPLTSGLDSDDYSATGAPAETGTADMPPEAPYSVEGEEQLEPNTN
jgi:hypothetical protein